MARGGAHPSLGVYRLIWRVGRALQAGELGARQAVPRARAWSFGGMVSQAAHPMAPSRGALPAPGNGQCNEEEEDPKVQSCSGCCGTDALCARALLTSRRPTDGRAGAMGRADALPARDRTDGGIGWTVAGWAEMRACYCGKYCN